MGDHCSERLATDIAALSQNWGPGDILSGCGMVLLAKTLVGLRIRAIRGLGTMTPNVADVAYALLSRKELHLSMTLYLMLQPGLAPQPMSASCTDVDVSAAIKKRPRPPGSGRPSSPTQEMANSFPRESARAQSASPPTHIASGARRNSRGELLSHRVLVLGAPKRLVRLATVSTLLASTRRRWPFFV